MDLRMERISEVTEPDNLDIHSDNNSEYRKIDKSVSKMTTLPKLQESIQFATKTNQSHTFRGSQAGRSNAVRKTRSTPDVFQGSPLSKLNVHGTSAILDDSPRGKNNKQLKSLPDESYVKTTDFQKKTYGEIYNRSQNNLKETKNKSKSLDDIRGINDKTVQRTITDAVFNTKFKFSALQGASRNGKNHIEKQPMKKEVIEGLVLNFIVIMYVQNIKTSDETN